MTRNGFDNFEQIPEGYVLNSWFYSRMIRNNKNILAAVIGKTGSGKSWFCLSACESWYGFKFKRAFPVDNVCFSIDDVTRILREGKLERGEILILEEAGVNMGNLDFQNKVSKSFNYILQSFRSMNIGLMMNLPYFAMLNKQTRMLMHLLLETQSIERKTNKINIKPLILDYNQRTGDDYYHFPQVLVDGMMEKVQMVSYGKPSDALIEQYEKRKNDFVLQTIENLPEKKEKNMASVQMAIIFYLREIKGLNNDEVAKILNNTPQSISRAYYRAIEKGINIENIQKYAKFYEKYANMTYSTQPTPLIS